MPGLGAGKVKKLQAAGILIPIARSLTPAVRHIHGRIAAHGGFHPTRKPSTGWFKVLPAVPFPSAVPFCTAVSARMKPALGRDSSSYMQSVLILQCFICKVSLFVVLYMQHCCFRRPQPLPQQQQQQESRARTPDPRLVDD